MVAYASVGDSRGPYVIGVDGGRPRPLADRCPRAEVKRRSVEVCGEPAPEAAAWSPDGSRIAWLDFAEGTVPGGDHWNVLSFVNPDNTGLREAVARLPGEFGGNSLVWSPDGSRLAFWMGDEVPGQIYVIKADGSGLRRITPSGDNRWPAWSPDGSRIAFVHNGTLYTMAADGSDMHEVKGVEPDGAIAWNPVSTVVSSDHREHAGNARSANAA
jgi:Tol biopolymer transport system component